jgi:hypothetical protein
MKLKIVAYPSSLPIELLVKLFCQTLFPKQLSSTKKLLVNLFKKNSFISEAELCKQALRKFMDL